MLAMPPSPTATRRAQLPVSQQGATVARMRPVAGEDATCHNAPRVTNAKPLATRRICHRVGSQRKAPCLPVLFYAHLCPLFSHVPAGVSEGLGDPRGMCGVPIGTLRFLVVIRGLQTLGYSCGVAPPLLPLAGDVSSALRAWLACAWRAPAGVSEGLGDPRGMCGVPIGTLRFLVA